MFTTGNATVDSIGQMHLEGNVIPHTWYENIRLESTGKPDLNAITLLGEIVYWYRPTHVKEEETGRLLGIKKRFKADLLQRSYDSFADQFGFSKKQVKEAMDRLENIGVIKRDFRTINSNGSTLSNVLFIDLNVGLLKGITFEGERVLPSTVGGSYPVGGEGVAQQGERVSPSTVGGHTPQGGTYTEITTETTNTEITNTETTQGKNKSRKRVYDESSVHYQLAYLLYQKILQDDQSFKMPNMDVWSDYIRLMMERDDRTEEQIKYLINWSQNNSFWKSNILSTKKLREKATTLIRQIKADSEKAKADEAKANSRGNYRRGREEKVPDWLLNRNKESTQLAPVVEPAYPATDFEVERQKILAKLGG